MGSGKKIRVLIGKVGCDIHERGVLTLMRAFKEAGIEVIYTGRFQTPEKIAKAAVEEGIDLIALSDHTGSLPIIAANVLGALQKRGAPDIKVMAGGLISPEDSAALQKMGVEGNYGPGTPLDVIVDHVKKLVTQSVPEGQERQTKKPKMLAPK